MRRSAVSRRIEVTGLCFTPGGKTILSAGADLTVREWRVDATQDELLAWIRDNRYVPELTPEQRAMYQVDLLKDSASS